MSRSPAPKLGAYAWLTALGALGALVLGRAEPLVLVAPFALFLAAGLAIAREPRVEVRVTRERERALEGDEIEATIEIEAETPIARLEVLMRLPEGIELVEGVNPVALRLTAGGRRTLRLRLRCSRWGAYGLGEVFLRAQDAAGLFRYERAQSQRLPLKVYPAPETLQTLLAPLETQVFAGNRTSRVKGDGLEFADIRAFAPGDRVRRINWRVSARRGSLHVNEQHPERNSDVVLLLDSFTEARRAGEPGTLDLAVRAAATLAGRYLEQKDRVGLVSFGGTLNWLLPGGGPVQLYRVVDALLDTQIVLSYAWKGVAVIPPRTLPPKALVIALTPLLDERAVGTVLDLRARGFDLAVLEVSPVPFVSVDQGEREELAYRLWLLRREALRARYAEAGVPVAEWRAGMPLAGPLEEVRAYRRRAGRAHA